MPAYNAAQYIEKTVKSLQSQTHRAWELIIVDDCSTDSTRDIVVGLAESDKRIRLISLEKNFGGPAGPRNVGVKNARYEVIAFLDADDIWHPQKLELQLPYICEGSFSIVCSQIKDFYDDSSIKFEHIVDRRRKAISAISLRCRNQVPNSSVLIKRELILGHPFNEAMTFRAVEDYDSWLRIVGSGAKCIKLLSPLVQYRKIAGQISGSKLDMLKKVFMVHRFSNGVSLGGAILFTFTHLVGALYQRGLLKRM
jgi:teichuronic acid biosynthesis glycosyltransferase TuaG